MCYCISLEELLVVFTESNCCSELMNCSKIHNRLGKNKPRLNTEDSFVRSGRVFRTVPIRHRRVFRTCGGLLRSTEYGIFFCKAGNSLSYVWRPFRTRDVRKSLLQTEESGERSTEDSGGNTLLYMRIAKSLPSVRKTLPCNLPKPNFWS